MDHISTSHMTTRFLMEAGVVILLAVYFHRHAGRRWFAPVFLILGLVGVSYHEGVIKKSAVGVVSEAATGKLDAASLRAKAIGNQAHSTSAGGAGKTNEAYKKRMK
ncbi:MAG: hypothetical protein KC502_10735 [Myxococcales bacterium]|nr:hypothetical protein [Myxococcales bacterium]